MTIQIPTGYSQVIHKFLTNAPSGFHTSTITYGVHSPPTEDSAIALDNAFADNWGSSLYTNTTPIGTVMQNHTDGWFGASAWSGERTGATSPPQVACLIRKNTAKRGRENQGRMYFPGLMADTEVSDSGTIVGSLLTDLITHADNWLEDLASATLPMVILHSSATTPTPVTTLSVETTIATQRRRLR